MRDGEKQALSFSISWQSGVLWPFLISGRPDGFLGQNGNTHTQKREGDYGWVVSRGGAEWDLYGIQREGWTHLLKDINSLQDGASMQMPIPSPVLTFHEGPGLSGAHPPLLSILLF